jgi:hypothetical protein
MSTRKPTRKEKTIFLLRGWNADKPPMDRYFIGLWFSGEQGRWVSHRIHRKGKEWYAEDNFYPWEDPVLWRDLKEGEKDYEDEYWFDGG